MGHSNWPRSTEDWPSESKHGEHKTATVSDLAPVEQEKSEAQETATVSDLAPVEQKKSGWPSPDAENRP